jgi:hypothetical protein
MSGGLSGPLPHRRDLVVLLFCNRRGDIKNGDVEPAPGAIGVVSPTQPLNLRISSNESNTECTALLVS